MRLRLTDVQQNENLGISAISACGSMNPLNLCIIMHGSGHENQNIITLHLDCHISLVQPYHFKSILIVI